MHSNARLHIAGYQSVVSQLSTLANSAEKPVLVGVNL
jgi:hypothetical protein